jgi:RES domain-containing protein
MGRCNFPNHPVFYASNSPLVAMLEVFRASDFKTKKLYLSSWSIIPSEDIFYFESFLRIGLTENSLYNNFNTNLKHKIGNTFNGLVSQNQILGMIEYLRFVDEQFVSDDTYSVSASLAHRRLYAKGNFGSDMIMYPSVQSKGNEANLAINPNFVENNMRLNRVYIVSLQDYDFLERSKFSMTFHRFGEVSKNSILWNDDLSDEKFKKAITMDFGTYEDFTLGTQIN